MPLNLITDRWIPVRLADGGRRLIGPDEITEPDVVFPDWSRADLNVACLEMLIGLVFLADPPTDDEDWEARQIPDRQRLKDRLQRLAPAFRLDGTGPLFLQDLEPIEGEIKPPDALFIDSAGSNTIRNNGDLMVHRDRYPVLDLPFAAMALYTLQAFAPAGGQGNRTSMRGGGPMVTLIDPGTGHLWDLIWANVPDGMPVSPEVLPWMKPTRTSEADGSETYPHHGHAAEAFFGMPRRIRLMIDAETVTGFIQKPRGTNYAGWLHPLTPYTRQKPDSDFLPVHPRAGRFSYQNWLGVVVAAPSEKRELRRRAAAIDTFERRVLLEDRRQASVIVSGWSMDNMKPRDFIFSRQPLLPLGEAAEVTLRAMIEAADTFRYQLRDALKPVLAEGSARDALVEAFFTDTQDAFEQGLAALLRGALPAEVAATWIAVTGRVALGLFERAALPGLDQRPLKEMAAIIDAREVLRVVLMGWRRPGVDAYAKLGLTPRTRKTSPKPGESGEGEST
ncbi:type I-E CRISPR-associated protein Cse1/CasA [Tistrella mobilis]|uniref:type I-E CRISPR-associated protein Cse1/CasA n=1 Tax=Tistrella mobilis TaxID=171437 RepID=UPI003558F3B2